MRKIFKKLMSVDEAWNTFINAVPVSELQTVIEIPLEEAEGYVVAENVVSPIDVPPFDRSSVDGFAVKAESTFSATEEEPVELRIVGEIPAGSWFEKEIKLGEAADISTGAPIPLGADSVVMVEDTYIEGDTVFILRPVAPGENVMSAGADIMYGETIVKKGTLITHREVAVMAATGITKVKVFKKPRVAVISTGNELIEQGTPLKPGKIYDINRWSITEAIKLAGGIPVQYGIVPDDEQKLRTTLSKALAETDIVTVSGGTSAGAGDLMYRIIDDLGAPGILVHGIRVQPGKPTILSLVNGKPLIGLPGYPTSGLMIFDIFVAPLIRGVVGRPMETPRPTITAKILSKIRTPPGREQFLLLGITPDMKGNYLAYPVPGGSGAITTLTRAMGYTRIPENVDFIEPDTDVTVYLFVPKEQIPPVSMTASSCLGLEQLLLEFEKQNPKLKSTINYTVIASTGSLSAVRRGEADIAGMHLLDPKTGTYNVLAIKQVDVKNELLLFRGYSREQGIITAPNNPKKIETIKDLVTKNIRFVNRNEGSGTRILFDHLLSQLSKELGEPISNLKNQINGYRLTAKSHTAVAARIKQGMADAGIGLRYVADLYGLHFIPLTKEHYDFVVRKDRIEKPAVKAFTEFLKNEHARDLINSLQGYEADNTMGTPINL